MLLYVFIRTPSPIQVCEGLSKRKPKCQPNEEDMIINQPPTLPTQSLQQQQQQLLQQLPHQQLPLPQPPQQPPDTTPPVPTTTPTMTSSLLQGSFKQEPIDVQMGAGGSVLDNGLCENKEFGVLNTTSESAPSSLGGGGGGGGVVGGGGGVLGDQILLPVVEPALVVKEEVLDSNIGVPS